MEGCGLWKFYVGCANLCNFFRKNRLTIVILGMKTDIFRIFVPGKSPLEPLFRRWPVVKNGIFCVWHGCVLFLHGYGLPIIPGFLILLAENLKTLLPYEKNRTPVAVCFRGVFYLCPVIPRLGAVRALRTAECRPGG